MGVLPLCSMVISLITGEQHDLSKEFSSILNLLRMLRLLRVLRLVRLLRAIKPLYNLLLGVMESLKAMQWVMVLTLLTLYAGAITWTSLVGKDMLPPPMKGNESDEEIDSVLQAEAHKYFGSVPDSLFSLFKLMNGDTAVVSSVTHTVYGQLLFAGFMILSNWAVLAILTSVVSDNMISSSARAAEEEAQEKSARARQTRITRLNSIFHEVDKQNNDVINEEEWKDLLKNKQKNKVLCADLCDVTGLNEKGLQEMFDCASHDEEALSPAPSARPGSRVLTYDAYMDALEEETATADKQSVRNVILHLHGLEGMLRHIHSEMAEMRHAVNLGTPQANFGLPAANFGLPAEAADFTPRGDRPVVAPPGTPGGHRP